MVTVKSNRYTYFLFSLFSLFLLLSADFFSENLHKHKKNNSIPNKSSNIFDHLRFCVSHAIINTNICKNTPFVLKTIYFPVNKIFVFSYMLVSSNTPTTPQKLTIYKIIYATIHAHIERDTHVPCRNLDSGGRLSFI